MGRVAHLFFTLALLLYYVPRVFKVKKRLYINLHIISGSLSIAAMLYEFIIRAGTEDFIKYLGFTAIMLSIGISGFLIKKNYKLCKNIHIASTVLFFLYLAGIIIF
mgnify:FL=1